MNIQLSEDLDVTVNRDRGAEMYNVEMSFRTPDGSAYSVDRGINMLIDERVKGRSDITQDVVKEAVHALYEYVVENYDKDIVEIICADIVVEQKLRRTPHEERNWDADDS